MKSPNEFTIHNHNKLSFQYGFGQFYWSRWAENNKWQQWLFLPHKVISITKMMWLFNFPLIFCLFFSLLLLLVCLDSFVLFLCRQNLKRKRWRPNDRDLRMNDTMKRPITLKTVSPLSSSHFDDVFFRFYFYFISFFVRCFCLLREFDWRWCFHQYHFASIHHIHKNKNQFQLNLFPCVWCLWAL